METRLAYTFIKVAELGNITKAAERLGYSQASVTSHIQQLEKELGLQLFDRIGRGIQLTEAGMRFQPYALKLIRASEDADAFALDTREPEGDLVLEASSTAGAGVLARFLPEFHELYPQVHVIVRLGDETDVLIDRVKQNLIDFAMFLDRKSTYDQCIIAAEQYERFVFVAPASDPITQRKRVEAEDIFQGPFISTFTSTDREQSRRSVLDDFLLEHELSPDMEMGANAPAITCLRQGFGRSYLPISLIEDDLLRGDLAIIDTEEVDSGMYTQVVYSGNRWLNPQMQAFIRFVQAKMG